MNEKYAVLPCNGLDKCAGQMSREIAQLICDKTGSELICPVFYRVADARYDKIAKENLLVVIDGCATRCASKLAADKGLKIARKLAVADEAQKRGQTLPLQPLRPGAAELALCAALADELTQTAVVDREAEISASYPAPQDYLVHKKGKFIFRVPPKGYFFTENDCWVQPVGNRARIGITDYMQQSLSDIMFVTLPTMGASVDQFDEAGTLESGKAVFELICPVSGRIVAVNNAVLSSPELINQNPYEQGWIAELELSQFEDEREFLLSAADYMTVLKKKADEYHEKKQQS